MGLQNRTVLTTRSQTQSQDLRAGLEKLGARVLEFPLIEIAAPESWKPVDEAISRVSTYDWLLFTSTNAVDRFMSRAGSLGSIKIAAVGSSTAKKLGEWNLKVSLVPDDFRAEGLLESFPKNMGGVRILFPRAETARELLPEELRRRGAQVEVVPVYRTVRPEGGLEELERVLAAETIDCIVFTSPSTVRNFVETLEPDKLSAALQGTAIAAIGPVTRESAQSYGLKVAIEPEQSTIPALVEAIQTFFARDNLT